MEKLPQVDKKIEKCFNIASALGISASTLRIDRTAGDGWAVYLGGTEFSDVGTTLDEVMDKLLTQISGFATGEKDKAVEKANKLNAAING